MPRTTTISLPAAGLYAAKPAFQRTLGGAADWLAARCTSPDALTGAAVGCGALAGLSLAVGAAQPLALLAIPPLALARLALNALDGMVAQRRGVARPWGKVLNEVGDRLADLAFLAPLLLLPGAPSGLVIAALGLVLLVSYSGVLAEAAGAGRQYGGPMGKADRMAWLSLAAGASALLGQVWPLAVALPAVLLVGSLATLAGRLRRTYAAVR